MRYRLEELRRYFDGIIPAGIATCSADGVPNVTYLSQVHYVDARHVALSRQFFNKTTRNILENPRASISLVDPLTFEKVIFDVRFVRSETGGPLFESMAARIEAIAAHTGMAGIFKLIAADVFEVLSVEDEPGCLEWTGDAPPTEELWGPSIDVSHAQRPEIYSLQRICGRVSQAKTVDELCEVLLKTLDEELGFRHARVLIPECPDGTLVVRAGIGFGDAAVGRRIPPGQGILGTVAVQKRLLRLNRIDDELRYVRAIKERVQHEVCGAELPLPGLPNARSHIIVPLVARGRLTGILAVEDPNPLAIEAWHEAFLEVLAAQVAVALDQLREDELEPETAAAALPAPSEPPPAPARRRAVRRFLYYRSDECVFCDGEYLIRGVPAKILWKVLDTHRRTGRKEFSNRELRLDASLGLPELRDNLEARLTLLRKRLGERCPEIELAPAGRGRFTLELGCDVELAESEVA